MTKPFFRITSGFDAMDTPLRTKPHTGIDVATFEGTPLPSVSKGYVTQTYSANIHARTGNGLKIKSEDGTEVVYAHLQEVSVKIGDKIDVGEIIGKTGNTGNSSGPHLHLGVKENGEWVDPSRFIDTLQDVAHKLLDPSWATVQSIFSIFHF